MKNKLKPIVLEKVGSLATNTLKMSANTTCMFMTHQAKMPEGIEKFKKKI